MLNTTILWNVTPCSLVAEQQCAAKLSFSSAVLWNNLLPWTWKITAILHGVTFRKTNLHSHRCDNLKYCRDFNIAGGRGVQIPEVKSPRQLNSDDGATHLWVFRMETASYHSSGTWNFDVAWKISRTCPWRKLTLTVVAQHVLDVG